ncbi:MAG TPA: putative toxin-antitoxin system toxin component, PIN family, partial [Pyrinomonadaceae bacterium]|nr:putative toxin-antitoxin system toxin component, PIN family [Pyrinomonadaceae bacterium]
MKIRVILDTNLWISYLISKKLSKIDLLFERDEIVLLFSNELLDEFVEVANRPRFRKYFSPDDIEELLDLFDAFGEIVRV